MILQIHHQQIKGDKTKLVKQIDIDCLDDIADEFIATWKTDPPPIGWVYMICDKESEHWEDAE